MLEPGRGAPYLVLAEQFDVASSAQLDLAAASSPTGGSTSGGANGRTESALGERYRALGNPVERMPPGGPSLTWFDRAPPTGFPQDLPNPLFDLQTRFAQGELLREGVAALAGDGWRASPQGDYTQITLGDRTWRAVVGYPLWAGGDYLLVYADAPVLYKLMRPAAQASDQ